MRPNTFACNDATEKELKDMAKPPSVWIARSVDVATEKELKVILRSSYGATIFDDE